MSAPFTDTAFPRGPLYAAGMLLGVALIAVLYTRLGDGLPQAKPVAAVASMDLHFRDRDDGAVTVHDAAAGGALIEVMPPGTNGFLRATLRGLARDRKRRGAGPEIPFRLAEYAGGRIALEDPVTGRRVELQAFGHTNAEVFARLLARRSGASHTASLENTGFRESR
jgi:putative photosynthetic complex assembly protein